MFNLDIPKTFASITGAGISPNSPSINNVRELQRRLKALDPALRKALLREAKAPAKPIQAAVRSRLGSVSVPSGMTQGRLNWNAATDAKGRVHPPTDVKIEFRTKSSGFRNVTSLVRVRAASPAVAFLDMAGRSGRYIDAGYKGTGETRVYPYKGGVRRHKVRGQGRALIRAVGGSASRFVYPSAESALPQAMREVDNVLKAFASKVNMKGF